ncbi:PAS domain-containing sensor histidine kinase [Desulfonatronum sp. SC1]|uniref:PAS domain-containing sensor histidine kinase n=1 Tax=Desulfonatronum sp. SC1 TaxID=2109626 RepID=UPI001304E9DE|nr:PAS domain-containing sensor histidine kinase [Desulfonatronum sp. SC1]
MGQAVPGCVLIMPNSASIRSRTGATPETAFGVDDPDFFDHAPIGIFTSTPEGRFLSVNPVLARMYGYETPGELLESIRDIAAQAYVDPAEREEFKRVLEKYGQVFNYESRRLHRDGTIIWVSVNARGVRDETGGIALYQGFTTDITKIKLDHQKLWESENRNKALLNALPDLMFLLNREGVFLDYHAPGGGLLMEPDLFLGRYVMDVLEPDIGELTLRHIDQVAKDGACVSYGYEAEIEGETRYFESRLTACGLNFLAIVRDVTVLRRSREALGEQTRLLEKITDNMLEIVAITDLEGKVRFLSKSNRLLGYALDSQVGRNIMDLVHPEDKPWVMAAFEDFLAVKDGTRMVELRYQRADGSYIWLETVGSFIFDSQGNPREILFSSRDITEKKQLEIIRKEQQEQLIQASKMTALGTLVAGVAHEINNPNNLIMLNTPILERSWKDASPILDEYWRKNPDLKLAGIPFGEMCPHVLDLFAGISEGSRRIAKIITELKDFARQSPLNMADQVDINEVVGSALVLIRKTISGYTDDFNVILASRIPLIQGDHQKLEQVVVNLLVNACQSLVDKKQAVTLETFHAPDRQAVAVRITDQGEGIRPEDMSRIIDPFYSTRHKIGGTGLGLSISSAIVQDHGGALHFDSQPGQGTTVTVYLGKIVK